MWIKNLNINCEKKFQTKVVGITFNQICETVGNRSWKYKLLTKVVNRSQWPTVVNQKLWFKVRSNYVLESYEHKLWAQVVTKNVSKNCGKSIANEIDNNYKKRCNEKLWIKAVSISCEHKL